MRIPCSICGDPIAPAGRKLHMLIKHGEGRKDGDRCGECDKKNLEILKLKQQVSTLVKLSK